jgi:hypothetical protein
LTARYSVTKVKVNRRQGPPVGSSCTQNRQEEINTVLRILQRWTWYSISSLPAELIHASAFAPKHSTKSIIILLNCNLARCKMDEEASENKDRDSDRADPDAAEQGDDDTSENDDEDSESESLDSSRDSDAPSHDQGRNNTGDDQGSEDLEHLSVEEQKETFCRKLFNVVADNMQYIPKISGIDKQDLAVLIRIMVFANQIRHLASQEEILDWQFLIKQEFREWQYFNSLGWDNDSGRITSLLITAGSQSHPRFQQVDGAAAAPYNIVHEDIGRLDELNFLRFFGKFHKVPFKQLGQLKCLRVLKIRQDIDPGAGIDVDDCQIIPTKFENVGSLQIWFPGLDPSMKLWLQQSHFPALHTFDITVFEEDIISDSISDFLVPFQASGNLHNIRFLNLTVYDASLITTVDTVLKFFLETMSTISPKLENFVFHFGEAYDEFHSFVPLASRIKQGHYHPDVMETLCKSMRVLDIKLWKLKYSSRDERDSLITILCFFRRLHKIDPRLYNPSKEEEKAICQAIEFLLRKNYGCGDILMNLVSNDKRDILRTTTPAPRIPLSFWPFVMERAVTGPKEFEHRNKATMDASVIYRLLRPNSEMLGPALERILHDQDANIMDRKRPSDDASKDIRSSNRPRVDT